MMHIEWTIADFQKDVHALDVCSHGISCMIRGTVGIIQLDEHGGFVYQGCNVYVNQDERYCRQPLGSRRGQFPEEDVVRHTGPCGVKPMYFYRFRLQVQDHTGCIDGIISHAASYMLGGGLRPVWGNDFAGFMRAKGEELIESMLGQSFCFQVDYIPLVDGPGLFTFARCCLQPFKVGIPPLLTPTRQRTPLQRSPMQCTSTDQRQSSVESLASDFAASPMFTTPLKRRPPTTPPGSRAEADSDESALQDLVQLCQHFQEGMVALDKLIAKHRGQ